MLPHLEEMQQHITIENDLITGPILSITDHMNYLGAKLWVGKQTIELLKKNWDNTMAIIKKNHQEFLDHFGLHL